MTEPARIRYHVTPVIDPEGDGHRIVLLCQTTDLAGCTVGFLRRGLGVWPLGQGPAIILATEAAREEAACWEATANACKDQLLARLKEQA